MKKFLLVSLLEKEHRHLGCLALYSFLKKNNCSAELLFIPDKSVSDAESFLNFCSEKAIDLVGFSVTTQDFHFAAGLTETLHQCLPNVKVIWGGIHPTTLPDECLEHADYLCSGQGEDSLLALLKALENGENDLDAISGISYWANGKKHFCSRVGVNGGMASDYPGNYYDWEHFYLQDKQGIHGFTIEDYKKYSKHNGDSYSLITSSYCPFNCSYCINNFLHKLYGPAAKFNRRSVAAVMEEIRRACHDISTVNFINFLDDHFLNDPEWVDEFIVEYASIGKPFIIRAAPKSFDAEILKRLKQIGLEVVQMGIQSGSGKTHREIFHRFFNENDLLASANLLADAGIKTIYDIIIDNEFESDSDRLQTLSLILKLRHPYNLSLFSLTPFPGTDLIRMYKERNITPRINPYSEDYTHHDRHSIFFRFATIIPHVDHALAVQLFQAWDKEGTKYKIDDFYYSITGERQ